MIGLGRCGAALHSHVAWTRWIGGTGARLGRIRMGFQAEKSCSANPRDAPVEAGIPEYEIVRSVEAEEGKKSFLRKAEVKEFITVEDKPVGERSFEDFEINDYILAGLKENGWTRPTPIQSAAIPEILKGENCALQSYTGSGKTLAYLVPVLTKAIEAAREEWHDQSLRARDKGQLQALLVAPSQELAMQIVRVAQKLLPEEARSAVQQLIGGANINRQIEGMKGMPLIAVGTPGRIAELSRRGIILSHKCPILVLDEVDQLSKIQFREDVLRIADHTGKKLDKRQTIAVSATLTPHKIDRISPWAPDAKFVFIGSLAAQHATPVDLPTQTISVPKWGWGNRYNEEDPKIKKEVIHGSISMPPSIRHGYVVVEAARKMDTLRRAIHAMESQKCLVFMNYSARTKDALFKLSSRGMPVGSLHGDKSKMDRASSLQKFRSGSVRALIVSDVVTRGIDVEDCDAVFNVELPSDASHYAHRAGRTGRMGRTGWVLSLVERREVFVVEKFAKQLKIEIPQVDIRNGEVSLRKL